MRTAITINDILNSKCGARNQHLQPLPKKRNKYQNIIVEFDGKTFHSLKERDRYITLRARQAAGEIIQLACQVKFDLESEDQKICSYIADFTYTENGRLVVEDVKSRATRKLAVYRLKNKLMKANFGIDIKEV